MTATAVQTISDTNPLTAASGLQKLLPQLVALSLNAKQTHWNVTGVRFFALHVLTDEIARATRDWADRVAERAVALGFAVDARPQTVATFAGKFPGGRLRDSDAIIALGAAIDALTYVIRTELNRLETADAVTGDIYVDLLEGLDKYRWMLRAQTQ